MKISKESKIRGMFYGIAIGDALGAPVETYSQNKIRDIHGTVDDFVPAIGHKWFDDGRKPGFITDDTQLSLAVTLALLTAKDFDMDRIAAEHVVALKNPAGWGNTTRWAIEKIEQGVHWSKSGICDVEKSGSGNGVPMKIGPIAAWYFATQHPSDPYQQIAEFAAMTHYTDMGVQSGIAHFDALHHCFTVDNPYNFSGQYFCEDILDSFGDKSKEVLNSFDPPLKKLEHQLLDRMVQLSRISQHKTLASRQAIWSNQTIREIFGSGSCYVYDSLPFAYAFFLRNPFSFQSVIDVVNAGGDTDTNGSMVGALLGALNGVEIFPQDLLNTLQCKDELTAIADKFIETFIE